MRFEKRRDPRYNDFGRVDASDICVMPGILADISLLGCRVRFPVEVDIDTEADYEFKITPARKSAGQPFILIGHPMWIQNSEGAAEVGFRILRSPGTRQLEKYVLDLARSEERYAAEELCEQVCL